MSVPGGLYFVLDTSRSTDKQTCLLLKVRLALLIHRFTRPDAEQNQPIPFSSIFFQYGK